MHKKDLGNMLDSDGRNLGLNESVLEVFVNGEYVGNKADIGNQHDQVQEIDGYLQDAGFSEYNISTQQNEINVVMSTNYNQTINHLKDSLQEYLNLQ